MGQAENNGVTGQEKLDYLVSKDIYPQYKDLKWEELKGSDQMAINEKYDLFKKEEEKADAAIQKKHDDLTKAVQSGDDLKNEDGTISEEKVDASIAKANLPSEGDDSSGGNDQSPTTDEVPAKKKKGLFGRK